MHQCIKLFYFGMTLNMFRTVLPSIIRSSRLCIQQQAYVKRICLSYACCCMYSLELLTIVWICQTYLFDICLLLYVRSWTPDDRLTYVRRICLTYACCCMYSLELLTIVWHMSNVSVWHMPVAECAVLNSWWWTARPSETCRVSFQNKIIWYICAASWFYYRSSGVMKPPTNTQIQNRSDLSRLCGQLK